MSNLAPDDIVPGMVIRNATGCQLKVVGVNGHKVTYKVSQVPEDELQYLNKVCETNRFDFAERAVEIVFKPGRKK